MHANASTDTIVSLDNTDTIVSLHNTDTTVSLDNTDTIVSLHNTRLDAVGGVSVVGAVGVYKLLSLCCAHAHRACAHIHACVGEYS